MKKISFIIFLFILIFVAGCNRTAYKNHLNENYYASDLNEVCGIESYSTDLNEKKRKYYFSIPVNIRFIGDLNASKINKLADKNNTIELGVDTVNYALMELKEHLKLAGIPVDMAGFLDYNRTSIGIYLINSSSKDNETIKFIYKYNYNPPTDGFIINPVKNGSIHIIGYDNISLLHGVYRFLDLLGYSWYDSFNSKIPTYSINDKIQWFSVVEYPKIKYRGYWMGRWKNSKSLESFDDFVIWMARNRLNLGADFKSNLKSSLGVYEWKGGHHLIQEILINKKLFSMHPRWYSSYDGERRLVSSLVNPNFSNREMAIYVADEILKRLIDGDLKNTDIINIWPVDYRGATAWDNSDESKKLGNNTDNLLFFYSVILERFNRAFELGELNRKVVLAGLSYYQTWAPPTNQKIINKLNNQNYLHVFYTNQHSWSDPLALRAGDRNTLNESITKNIELWKRFKKIKFGVNEYYNFSIYGGLSIDDYEHLGGNVDYFLSKKVHLFSYMHPLLFNPGPRSLLNISLAKLAWERLGCNDIKSSDILEKVRAKYFNDRYGMYSEDWKNIYSEMSKSLQNAAELFGDNSLQHFLFQEVYWGRSIVDKRRVVNEIIPQFLIGGKNISLPELGIKGGVSISIKGLNDSIAMHNNIIKKSKNITTKVKDNKIRKYMLDDMLWFESDRSRYRILKYIAAIYTAEYRHNYGDKNRYLRLALNELDKLKKNQVYDFALSIDQRSILDVFEKYLNNISLL